MSRSESLKKAQKKYYDQNKDKFNKKYRQIILRLNRDLDKQLISCLDLKENINQYIKDLIKKDNNI